MDHALDHPHRSSKQWAGRGTAQRVTLHAALVAGFLIGLLALPLDTAWGWADLPTTVAAR